MSSLLRLTLPSGEMTFTAEILNAEGRSVITRQLPIGALPEITQQAVAMTGGGEEESSGRGSRQWQQATRQMLTPTCLLLMNGRRLRAVVRYPEGDHAVTHPALTAHTSVRIPARWWVLTYDRAPGGMRLRESQLYVELRAGQGAVDALVAPWPFANVGRDGNVCWGGTALTAITSVVEAETLFFAAPFNYDLVADGQETQQALWRTRRLDAALTGERGVSLMAVCLGDLTTSQYPTLSVQQAAAAAAAAPATT